MRELKIILVFVCLFLSINGCAAKFARGITRASSGITGEEIFIGRNEIAEYIEQNFSIAVPENISYPKPEMLPPDVMHVVVFRRSVDLGNNTEVVDMEHDIFIKYGKSKFIIEQEHGETFSIPVIPVP